VISVSPLEGPSRVLCLVLGYPPGDSDRNHVRPAITSPASLDLQGSWMGGCHVPLGTSSAELNSPVKWLVVGATEQATGGPTMVYVNDRASDTDGDGLGNSLEAEVGTCPGTSLYTSCTTPFAVPNGIDTDGDGLHDDWELLGKPPSLPLPRWGADPRHKDAFIEVDRKQSAPALTTADAATIADIYAAAPWQKVRNPDERDGVALHFDLGTPCVAPGPSPAACATLWGDWGGHSVIPDAVFSPDVYGDPAYFAVDRRDVFTLAIAELGWGGGHCCYGKSVVFGSQAPGDDTVDAFAHEWGHLIGLQHGGGDDVSCKPNYESMMNYAFYLEVRKVSDGARPPLNATDMIEAIGVGEDPSYMVDIWQIASSGNALDWNRNDDPLTIPTIHSLGYPMWVPGKQCGSLHYHSEQIGRANAYPDKSPAVASYDGKVWILYWSNDGSSLAYLRFTPNPGLASLRECGPPENPGTSCGVIDLAPTLIPDAMQSSPTFVRCNRCPAADGLEADRLVGAYATWRVGEGVHYRLRSIDRAGRSATLDLLTTVPTSLANVAPYTGAHEWAAADPAVAVTSASIVLLYRATDGFLHQMLLSRGLVPGSDEVINVGGSSVAASTRLGRDPGLLYDGEQLYAYYVDDSDQIHRLRWLGGVDWEEDTATAFATVLRSATQPALVMAGDGLPEAQRMEFRSSSRPGIVYPLPNRRTWTNSAGHFSWTLPTGEVETFESFARNQWDTDYRGASRLTLFGGVEVAAEIGTYPTPVLAARPIVDPSGLCVDCDCHLGTRPDAAGGRTACGHPDGWGAADLDACDCPRARTILFRPLADGVVNLTLADFDDWPLVAQTMCQNLRGWADCHAPGTSGIVLEPSPCTLPAAAQPNVPN
jgi:hypothetical protein